MPYCFAQALFRVALSIFWCASPLAIAQQATSQPATAISRTPKTVLQTETDDLETDDKPDHALEAGVESWLLQQRVIFISGEIEPGLAETVIAQLLYLDAQSAADIYLYINSSGGEIPSGLAIFDTMRSLKSEIVTVGIGEASSMASILLAAGTKGKRMALPHARIMIHQPLSGVIGQATEIEIMAREMLYLKGLINRLLAELTGQSLQRVEADSDRDFFMSAQEAKAYGLIDQVTDKVPPTVPLQRSQGNLQRDSVSQMVPSTQ
ncbi:MAG TPA: ATP-dependent Clp protease proteolytic subunit [Leptolyngbyaceae cyanobacterium M33_DOE_097]|uniref:ATP-dependent Clp protease proteolytic subunit n=1 Tax=Oscillatoriales cyanobacterium SpSt-418 TaxID=2282169 RepID=A0A7C3PJ29_9CYAN|nr:ATP-dependent Clp protease proteolytic subunit [Leptolyngbyaceae cyanobacterium M33_DOE_097]